jgi:hypothetical protein
MISVICPVACDGKVMPEAFEAPRSEVLARLDGLCRMSLIRDDPSIQVVAPQEPDAITAWLPLMSYVPWLTPSRRASDERGKCHKEGLHD